MELWEEGLDLRGSLELLFAWGSLPPTLFIVILMCVPSQFLILHRPQKPKQLDTIVLRNPEFHRHGY